MYHQHREHMYLRDGMHVLIFGIPVLLGFLIAAGLFTISPYLVLVVAILTYLDYKV
jgi:hypothetical protein